MNILVLSDSHGRRDFMMHVLEKEKYCDLVFFLGDGLTDAQKCAELYPEKKFMMVRGNNDLDRNVDTEAYKYVNGITIMACHGHIPNVRVTLTELFESAKSVRANLVLYGHTHIQDMYNSPAYNICAVNPGALCNGNYCVIKIENGQYDIKFKGVFSP